MIELLGGTVALVGGILAVLRAWELFSEWAQG